MPIVVVQPAIESVGPLRGAVERGTGRPLAQHRADEALGLAVGARGVGPRPTVDEPPRPAGGSKDARAIAVPLSVSTRRTRTPRRRNHATARRRNAATV